MKLKNLISKVIPNRMPNARQPKEPLPISKTPPAGVSADIPSAEMFSKYGGVEAELLTIDLMEGHEFEFWVADLLSDIGFRNVRVTPGSGDHGVDVLAEKEDIMFAIQCKRYNSDLGNSPIQEVFAGKNMYNCHVGAVATNKHFTSGARQLAKATGVLLWDRDWIREKLQVRAANAKHSLSHSYDEHSQFFYDAVDVVFETEQASVSMIQRKLQIGYAHAARLIDEMEECGIVGPFQGSRPREILISKNQWYLKK